MKITKTLTECSNCGLEGRTWPTPYAQDLCATCFEEWFEREENAPPNPTLWVLHCPCGHNIEGRSVEAQCECGRVYCAFQLY